MTKKGFKGKLLSSAELNSASDSGECEVAIHFKLNKDFSTNITEAIVIDMDTNKSIFVYKPQDNGTD